MDRPVLSPFSCRAWALAFARLRLGFGVASLGVLAVACSQDSQALAGQALQGDLGAAEARVQERLAEHPKEPAYHMAGFVLYRYLGAQGEPAKQQEYQAKAIAEYDWVAKRFGVTPDYGNMESTLRAQAEAAALMDAARAPLYNR